MPTPESIAAAMRRNEVRTALTSESAVRFLKEEHLFRHVFGGDPFLTLYDEHSSPLRTGDDEAADLCVHTIGAATRRAYTLNCTMKYPSRIRFLRKSAAVLRASGVSTGKSKKTMTQAIRYLQQTVERARFTPTSGFAAPTERGRCTIWQNSRHKDQLPVGSGLSLCPPALPWSTVLRRRESTRTFRPVCRRR